MNGFKLLFLSLLLSSMMLFVGCESFVDLFLEPDEIVDDDDLTTDFEDDTDEINDDEEEHLCVFGEWETVSSPSCTKNGKEARYCLSCFDSEIRDVPKIEHEVVIDSKTEPTDGVPGKTEGKHCSVCGLVIQRQEYIYSDDYTNPTKYSSDYAYNYLLVNYDNGSDMQAFYDEIDVAMELFHSSSLDAKSKIVSGNAFYYAAELDFSPFSLKTEEAIAVWSAYRIDHPLYYWMSNRVSYISNILTVGVFEDYADGDLRVEYNSMLYDVVERYMDVLDGRGSNYQIALTFHDGIILSADYAYESDGVTPQDDAYAHNILGVFLYGEGVCESYTKAFQLLLNYCDVDNIYVAGYANENHAWNLVKMDDGEWYWFDLTWDDTPKHGLGIKYSYFCVNDTDNVKIFDGSVDGFGTFIQDHAPNKPIDFGIDFNYSIPKRSSCRFDYEGPTLREKIIEIDGLSYVICGSDTCALIDIDAEGHVVIPETITYMGFDYTVAMIGSFENGKIVSGPVVKAEDKTYITPEIISITIPKTVKVIWDYAFIYAKTVEYYIVDAENDVYCSEGGVLYTKNFYTLIQYPFGRGDKSYRVSSSTAEIAYGAFGDGGNVFCPKNLKKLEIGANVEVYGACHFGRGYRDSIPSNESEIITITGYLEKMKKIFGFGLVIEK